MDLFCFSWTDIWEKALTARRYSWREPKKRKASDSVILILVAESNSRTSTSPRGLWTDIWDKVLAVATYLSHSGQKKKWTSSGTVSTSAVGKNQKSMKLSRTCLNRYLRVGPHRRDKYISFETGKETNMIWNSLYFGGRENQKSMKRLRIHLNRYFRERRSQREISRLIWARGDL